MTDTGDTQAWNALDLDALRFDDDLSAYDLDTLPEPGAVTVVPLIVNVDPELIASLERDAQVQGVSVQDLVRQRLKGAA